MLAAPPTPEEPARLALLRALDLLGAAVDPGFEAITRLAARLLRVPIALVSMVGEDRQWFRAATGLPGVAGTARDVAFCSHALLGDGLFIVVDALTDPRFADNPLVTGEPGIRAYAGMPLRSAEGHALGTLCVIDRVPREFDAEELQTLQELAGVIRRDLLQREATLCARQLAQAHAEVVSASEALYHATFEAAPIGIALVGLDGRWLRLNPRLCSLLQRTADELFTLSFQQITHPDDVAVDLGHVHRLLAGDADRYTLEKRFLLPDGGLLWGQLTVTLVRREGRPLHFISVVEDIGARREAEAALRGLHAELEERVQERTAALAESEHRLQEIADNLPVLIGYIDTEQRYRFSNRTYEQWFGLSPQAMRGQPMSEVLGEALYAARLPRFLAALAGERQLFQEDLVLKGRRRFMQTVYVPHHDATGEVAGVYVLVTDLTPQKLAEERLAELAVTDALTGLPNRRALDEHLAGALARARRRGEPVALLFVDVDRFKAVNDAHGHGTGDAVLREFARRLRAAVRESDVVARLAGDEFVLLLESSGAAGELDPVCVARKLLTALAAPVDIGAGPSPAQVGASIGIAMSQRQDTPQQLLERADRALYRAKAQGRNTFHADLPAAPATEAAGLRHDLRKMPQCR